MAKYKLPKGVPLVVVEWLDIQDVDDWNDPSVPPAPAQVVSVGWLVEDTPERTVIARSFDPESGQWCEKRTIPKAPVVSVKRKRARKERQ